MAIITLRIGIISAMQVELEQIYLYFPVTERINFEQRSFGLCNIENLQIISSVSKIGQVNAAIATTILIQKFNPDCLVFLGVAGAIDPLLNIGNIIIGETILHAEYLNTYKANVAWNFGKLPAHKYLADPVLLETAKQIAVKNKVIVKTGIIGSSDFFPIPDYMPLEYENTKIAVIDMESAGFHQVCDEFGKPGIIIRSVSNNAFQFPAVKVTKENMQYSAKNAASFVVNLIKTYFS